MSVIVKELSKVYGTQKAVNHISFEAHKGRVLGFLGPNGAGKSTTMKMLTAYLKPTTGSILIAGLDVQKDAPKVKRIIGFLPENTPLYQDMYVREFLAFVADTYGLQQAKTRIEEVITQVGLQSEAHKKIAALSKGYKQRLGLAQAIIHQPQVLILDEPTSGLDPNQLDEVRKLIRHMGQNTTLIISTHIMQEVEALCDDILIINKGSVVAQASLADLKQAHQGLGLEAIFKKLTLNNS